MKPEKKGEEESEEVEEEEEEELPGFKAGDIIDGSEQTQQVYFDDDERTVYVGEPVLGEDVFTAELVFALRRALPLLWSVDNFLLEAMLRSALSDGANSIIAFLEKRNIKVDSNMPRQLGPGDRLPDDLQDSLIWTMEATFGEGECAAVLIADVFTIAEVCKFTGDQKQGEGLQRSYMLKLGPDKFEPRKHFEVYKISASKATANGAEEVAETGLVPVDEDVEREAENDTKKPAPGDEDDEGDIPAGEDDATTIKDLKRYLHEMGLMDPEDYKAVMRRLFKTWHPDKAGDTPLSKRIFQMLRAHEQWYKKKSAGEDVGDDSWLDKDDITVATAGSAGGSADDGRQLAIEDGEKPEGDEGTGGQGSWFEEFEKEMLKSKKTKEDGGEEKEYTRMPGTEGNPEVAKTDRSDFDREKEEREQKAQEIRIVDKILAQRYLQEAKLELVATKRLMGEINGIRSMPSRAVWHCQQAVEMALKGAMLRTCGVAEEEVVGGAAHNLIDFITRLKAAEVNTEEQRRAQNVPLGGEDVDWLKRAYLAARYPKPGRYGVPTLLYTDLDADRALKLADGFIKWAENVEDLPDPNKFRRRWASQSKEEGIVKSVIKDTTPGAQASPESAPTALAPGDGRGALGQKGKAPPSKPPSTMAAPSQDTAKRTADGDAEQGPSKVAKPKAPAPAAQAAKAAGVKRPGDAVVVGGESEPPRRWARRAASTS